MIGRSLMLAIAQPHQASYLAREFAVGSFERIDRRCHCISSVTSSAQLSSPPRLAVAVHATALA
jgi:hypothetical protein